jgi:cytochrome b pre-mRNA-processing protein 3
MLTGIRESVGGPAGTRHYPNEGWKATRRPPSSPVSTVALKRIENRVLSWFHARARDRRTAKELYGAIVTQARQPRFFADGGVTDTPEGRAATIMLHLFLMLDRLDCEGVAGKALGRRIAEAFVTDIDDSLREMGVGDLAVPKNVKRAAAALYERSHAYRVALEAPGDGPLSRELCASLPGLQVNSQSAFDLARYVRRSREHLSHLEADEIMHGRVTFPPPDAII